MNNIRAAELDYNVRAIHLRLTNPGTDSLTPTLLQLTQYWLDKVT